MRTGPKILIGCLATPFVLVFFLLILVLAFRAAPIPTSENVTVEQADPIGGVTPEMLAAEGLTLSAAPGGRAVPVRLHLEEGFFTVKPAPAGTSIRVEGDYDRAVHDLKMEVTRDEGGSPAYSISFLPKYSMLRRVLSQGFVHLEEGENTLTVHIPRDLLIDLEARVAKGSSRLNLGGLALRSADITFRMGEHHVVVDEPNPVEMTSLVLNASMGEIGLEGLGLLRPRRIEVAGGMGEVRVDLGEEIVADTELSARMRMGEMTVMLPKRAKLHTNTTVLFGELSNPPHDEGPEDPTAPQLTVHGRVTMGELSFQRR